MGDRISMEFVNGGDSVLMEIVENDLYLGRDENDGDNSDNHFQIDLLKMRGGDCDFE